MVFTIFGATGDLTFRKLIPALYKLFEKGLLEPNFTVIGFARREWNDENFVEHLKISVDSTKFDQEKWSEFLNHIKYISSNFDNKQGYEILTEKIREIESKLTDRKALKVFYMSTAPEYFKIIAKQIKESSLCELCSMSKDSRIVIEKPYGENPEDACLVDDLLRKSFLPEHIYRIDHFLGKESAQNILVFRFANFIFERLWNKDHIDHIQIKADESLGVEDRGGYYDKVGAIKDMVPNHILQILSLVTMDCPENLTSAAIQKNRLDIIKNVYLYEDKVVRGQYEGYRDEKNVSKNSNTETFTAMKLGINKDKWQGVPIYIRTGKKLSKKLFEIIIKFKERDLNIYDKIAGSNNDTLIFRVNPDEGISLIILAKQPGTMEITPVTLDFCYRPTFNQPVLDSYVGLIQNVITQDQSLFASIDEVSAQWNFISKYEKNFYDSPIKYYLQNVDGPQESFDLLKSDERKWIENEQYTCAIR